MRELRMRLSTSDEEFEESEEEEEISQLGSQTIQLGCKIIKNIKAIKQSVLDFSQWDFIIHG